MHYDSLGLMGLPIFRVMKSKTETRIDPLKVPSEIDFARLNEIHGCKQYFRMTTVGLYGDTFLNGKHHCILTYRNSKADVFGVGNTCSKNKVKSVRFVWPKAGQVFVFGGDNQGNGGTIVTFKVDLRDYQLNTLVNAIDDKFVTVKPSTQAQGIDALSFSALH